LHQAEIQIQHPVGLHARPAAAFVRLAASFPAAVTLQKLDPQGRRANAKSILAVLGLGINQGDQVRIETEGDQAGEALQALLALVQENFGEGGA
jgi:phosphotransferase system HPr (HPr) family protein